MAIVKKVSILGCGWFGLALAKRLIEDGYAIKGSCTRDEKVEILENRGIEPFKVVFNAEEGFYSEGFFETDLVVISIPPNSKSGEASLYPEKLKRIKDALIKHQVSRVIFISSTGVYADDNRTVDETVLPQPETESGKALLDAENLLKETEAYKLSIVRFAGLIGPGRDPGRFFAGKKGIPNGEAPVNLIQQKDCVEIVSRINSKDAFGYIFNAASEEHPAKEDFYVKAAQRSGLEIPQFTHELKKWKIVASVNLKAILSYNVGPLDL